MSTAIQVSSWMQRKYGWIVDRARSGEPVAIDTRRHDMNAIIDFLSKVDGRGFHLQYDGSHNLLWVVQGEHQP